jgi:hypothetical protein
MEFLIDVCPEDVLPKILAFAGPQKTATLSKVNRVWRDVIAEEWTWRVLCEDLYKVCSCYFFVFFPFQINNGLSDQNRTKAPRNRVAGLQNALNLHFRILFDGALNMLAHPIDITVASNSGHPISENQYPGNSIT